MDTKSIIILGNGFDVALGIPTKYSQFYVQSKSLRDYAAEGNGLCQHILNNVQSNLWSDLENGLYCYSLLITEQYGEGNKEQAEKLKKDFSELRSALFDYLNSVAGTQVQYDKQAAVLGLNRKWHELQPQYLTFNYSINTAIIASMNNRYILNNDDTINESFFIYQHGSIYDTHTTKNHESDEIVLGIDPITQVVEAAHSFLYKNRQNLHDINVTMDYIKEKKLYIIYGCSVGDSDATYFKAIFNKNQHGKTFLVYGYGQDGIRTIQQNIERICGISIKDLKKDNYVLFMDCQNVGKTRDETYNVIDGYCNTFMFS